MGSDTTLCTGRNGAGGKWRCYYYKGNFYYPIDGLTKNNKNLIRMNIKKFKKDNKELIKSDRVRHDYKTLLDLFDEQMEEHAIG